MLSTSISMETPLVTDAFAYRSHLFCWTADGEVLIYNIDRLIELLEEQHGRSGMAAAYNAFCSRGIGASHRLREAFEIELREGGRRNLALRAEPDIRISKGPEHSRIFDVDITYDASSLATETGLLRIPLERLLLEENAVPQTLIGSLGACRSVTTGAGAVAGSFGKGGLHVLLNESSAYPEVSTVDSFEYTSARSSLHRGFVANYPSNEEYQPLQAEFGAGRRKDEVVLKSLRGLKSGPEESVTPRETRGYAHWDSLSRRLLDFSKGSIATYGQVSADHRSGFSRNLVQDEQLKRPISVSTTFNRSHVIEYNDSIAYWTAQGVEMFATGPCISVKSYSRSWRYRRLATATLEGEIRMIAVAPSQQAS